MTTRTRIGFAAGLYSTANTRLADELYELATTERLHMLGTSESQRRGVGRTVARRFGKDWGVRRRGEYLWIYRRDHFTPQRLRSYLHRLSHVKGLIDWRQFKMGDLWFTRHDGVKWRAMYGHAPSGVQSGEHWNMAHPGQVAASKQGFRDLGRRVRRQKRKRPEMVQTVILDSNLDQHSDHWRLYLTQMIGAPSIWDGRAHHTPGTHAGDRLIDTGHVYGAKVVEAYVSHVRLSSDHDAIVAVLDTDGR